MHILIIDDSRAHRLVLRNVLTQLGHKVTEAADSLEGLQHLQHEKSEIGMMLVNWHHESTECLNFVQKVRARISAEILPIMVISLMNSIECVQQALEAGADEFIMKPFTKEMLAAKMDLLSFQTGAKS